MSLPSNLVTIHPYFKVQPGKDREARIVMDHLIAKTRSEKDCLFYEFTVLGDEVFCREGYAGAAAVLHHLENVGGVIGEMLTISEMTRLEFHGPAAEIDQLREPLAHLNPAFFVLHSGIER